MAAHTRLRGGISGLALAALVTGLVLPPQHVHVIVDDHDHHHLAIEHAHWAPHQWTRLVLTDDDDDGTVLFVDRPALVRAAQSAVPSPLAVVVALLSQQNPSHIASIMPRTEGNAVRDGPLRGLAPPRAPPVVA